MREQLDKHRSIARHIIDGTISIDSKSEFEKMLQLFPENPALHTAYADLLVKKKETAAAAGSFGTAADLYLSSGKILSAILMKLMQWRLNKPTHDQARYFFEHLKKTEFPDSPAKRFFQGLSYPEFVALSNRIARVRLSSGAIIKKIGDPEKALYFIAGGAVRDTIYRPLKRDEKTQQKYSVYLTENDILGDVYPLNEEKISQSYTETVSGTEMAHISRRRLAEVCQKYPNVGRALIVLLERSRKKLSEDPNRGVRKAGRHEMPIKMNLEIYPEGAEDTPLVLKGFSRDISVGGVCVVVDAKYANLSRMLKTLNRSRIQVCFPGESMTLSVAGEVVWVREVSFEGQKTLALGIQFREMTPKMSGMLVVFADMLYHS